MSSNDRRSLPDGETLFAAGVGVLLVGSAIGLFVVDFGSARPTPVEFDETVSVGLTLGDELRLSTEERGSEERGVELPRMQVFYSQYPYVVGYYGVGSFVADRRDPAHEQQFGFPTAVYVTDYADRDIRLTDAGLPRTDAPPDWTPAEDAFYVVDSPVRTPAGPAMLPFGTHDAAAAFTDEHGGRVIEWDAVLETDVETEDAEVVRNRIESQRRSADRSVEALGVLRDRPVGAVVGEDGTTIQDAVDAAPPNTTVRIPDGTYNGTVEIDRPVTLRGAGAARIVGNGNGTVVTINASRTAIIGVNISGTGSATPDATVTDDPSHQISGASHTDADIVGDSSWDADVEDDYARGDAAIRVSGAEPLIAETEINTSAAGIILYESPGAVVKNTTIVGSDDYQLGHMGLVAMRSPGVIEGSRFVGGLDGVYTHRSDGIVIRNNEMHDNRMGIHLMFTSGALVSGNTISVEETTGIHVMTGPRRNAVVGNEVTGTETGISVGGSDSYVADNVLTGNDLGLRIETSASTYERNVVAENEEGVETWALLPTNRVTHNDFVANERHVAAVTGRLRVWTHDGEGNYWEGAIGTTDGTVIRRTYTPTDPVDSRIHRVDGAATLARAPALDALAGFQGSIVGMRSNAVIDTAPLCAPVNDRWFERTGRADTEPVCRSGTARVEGSSA
jgi:parallel beta-helix repeat protein